MKTITIDQFEAGLRDGTLTIERWVGQFSFVGLQEGNNEILFRVAGL